MNKIIVLLLAVLFVGGCKGKEQKVGCKGLCLTVVERTASNVVFGWTSSQPVESVALMCGVTPRDPNANTAGMMEIPSVGGTSGRVSLALMPNQVVKCNLHSVVQPPVVSNTVQVQ